MEKTEKQIEQGLVIVKREVSTIEELDKLVVSGKPSLEKSAEGLKQISAVSKIIKAEKEKIIGPAKQIIENTKKFWEPFEKTIAEIEFHIKSEQRKYSDKLRAEEAAAKKELEDSFKKGKMDDKQFEAAGKRLEKIEERSDLIKTYTYTGVRITDKSKIPLEFLEPMETAIKNALLQGIKIPGAELYTEQRVKK
jgi:hypothetical protein